ncbi:putative transporter [Wickerhamomyces ciferrii]|uniref:Transporter n=1 Tax=Wickerhamomyces ciferrii (strain ATCC 14091 / BCRC 22168 / CBS 111 / JCM 3599 / NBRC 0793 / NRRL Y-1031 F-60-10) TaxID=1206466 RepID=K0K9C4_WICCF|nr:putative transporter [Wickerhamomyces ciferrii]CCH41510.1 putative transporter [Wickerhamomyces ciferrii]
MAVANLISQTLQELQPRLRTNGFGIGNAHRKLSLTFIPPSTKSPLFQYGSSPGQRSFLSLGTDYEGLGNDRDRLGSIGEEDEDDELGGELSRTVSLPSQISERPDPELNWLLEEHHRHYSSVHPSDESEEESEGEDTQDYHGYQDDSDSFTQLMSRIRRNQHQFRKNSVTSVGSAVSVSQQGAEDFDHEKVTIRSEINKLLQYSIPLIITFLLEQIFSVVSVLVVGHIGKNELAAVSLATMTSNIVFAVFEGLATALDTLCPQAYGAGDLYGVGIHFQRCALMSMALFVPFGIIWWFAGFFLKFVVPEPELVRLASLFLKVMLPGAPAYILFENLKRYLQAQGIFEAGTYVLLICAPLNVLMSYLLVWNKYIGVGFIGAPIAITINFWMMFIMLVGYTVFIDGDKCWGGFSKKSLYHWKDLMHLAIPGVIMLEVESLSYEIMTLFASYFGTEYLAAQSAVSTIASLVYMISFSVGIASSTRIANFIGARRIDCAKLAAKIGIYGAVITGIVDCILMIVLKRPLAQMFSKDEGVVQMTVDIFPLIAVVQVFDSMNAVAGSCLRGQGMQRIGSYINLFVYYVIGMPLAWYFGYYLDFKLVGLWLSIGFGLFLIGVSESWFVLNADWQKIMNEADQRKEDELENGSMD